MSAHFDVIIIGTGPGGETLAYKLAPSGKRILLLERGGNLPREKENWSSKTVLIDNKYKVKETWKDKDSGTFHPGIHDHVGGISPEWPTRYKDLESYCGRKSNGSPVQRAMRAVTPGLWRNEGPD